jgi:omega-6 fatty acid desaturase (delta-12 desaturase)
VTTLGTTRGALGARLDGVQYGILVLSLLITVPAAGFLVRLFMIQRSRGIFRFRRANDWVGRAASVLTLTSYDVWRQTDAVHHASSGNLDHRGLGDVTTLTVREYLTLPPWGRLCYRIYRHLIVLFGIGPACLVLQQRLPVGMLRGGWRLGLSAIATNFAIAFIVGVVIWQIGIKPFLVVHLPITLIAGSIGVWLFFVQHQFDSTFWARDGEWSLHEAALYVHSEHRRVSCPSPLQPYSLLPTA